MSLPLPGPRRLRGRLTAFAGAGLLALGAVAIWLSSDKGNAKATNIPPQPAIAETRQDLEDAILQDEPIRPKSREEKRFARADRDDDGKITQDEYLANRKRNFKKLDLNGDGRLSFEEYAASGIKKFNEADKNKDRILLAAEFATTAPKPKSQDAKSSRTATAKCTCPEALAAISEESGGEN